MGPYWLLAALFVILMPLIGLYVMSLTAGRPTNLGVHAGKLAPCPASPNCVSTQAEDALHRIEPIRFTGTSADAMAKLKRALGELPRTSIVTESEVYLHAECASLIFRFVDDMEFWIDVANQAIHFRSASRVGHSDLGVNRARMESVRQRFAKV